MPKGLKIVLPSSPIRPVTLNGGKEMRAWYDVRSFSNLPEEDIEGFCAKNYS
jgi:phospholipase/carboxylesterase